MRYLGDIQLSDSARPGFVRVQLLRTGEWLHPKAPGGKLKIDKPLLDTLLTNFKRKLMGPRLPSNLNHDDKNFTISRGWAEDLEIVEDESGVGIDAYVKPTASILQHLKDDEIKYVSAELDFNYQDKSTGEKTPVIRGFAWTNLPYLKNMRPAEVINLADIAAKEGFEPAPDDDDDPDNDGFGGMPGLGSASDPDAKEDDLPDQCRSCSLLFNGTCPFQGIAVKLAAASDGTCPRYEAYDASATAPDPSRETNDDPDQSGGSAMTLAELEAQVAKLSEGFDSQKKENDLLKGLLDTERNSRIELSERTQRERNARFVVELSEGGILLPPQLPLVEKILLKAGGKTEGTINLSEECGGEEVDLAETTISDDIKELLRSMNPQVELSQRTNGGVTLKERPSGTVDFADLVETELEELAKERGVPKSTPNLYGEAARRAARKHKDGR